jgi:S-DNA-T family DNA segregation ATPase FtsK/SpoIIIE
LGFDEQGNLKIESLLDVNNLIVAGNSLSQKENLVDTILLSNLLRYDPRELKIILIDPTHYLDLYNDIIHLLSPVIYFDDRVISAFKWLLAEYDRRLEYFAKDGVRDLTAYNQSKSEFEGTPRILIVTFADFYPREVEDSLVRLTAHGARTGIYNIIVTDHTSGPTLRNTLKSNIPARAVFRLTSPGESKAIDVSGGEKLEAGELIYKPNYGSAEKLKAVFTPEINVNEVVKAVKEATTGQLSYSK